MSHKTTVTPVCGVSAGLDFAHALPLHQQAFAPSPLHATYFASTASCTNKFFTLTSQYIKTIAHTHTLHHTVTHAGLYTSTSLHNLCHTNHALQTSYDHGRHPLLGTSQLECVSLRSVSFEFARFTSQACCHLQAPVLSMKPAYLPSSFVHSQFGLARVHAAPHCEGSSKHF